MLYLPDVFFPGRARYLQADIEHPAITFHITGYIDQAVAVAYIQRKDRMFRVEIIAGACLYTCVPAFKVPRIVTK